MMRSPVELEMTEGSVDGREHLRCADALISGMAFWTEPADLQSWRGTTTDNCVNLISPNSTH